MFLKCLDMCKVRKHCGKRRKFWLPEKLQCCYPFPKRQILDDFKLKGFAAENFKLDENER